jgi:two-component system, sensor histidine kinase
MKWGMQQETKHVQNSADLNNRQDTRMYVPVRSLPSEDGPRYQAAHEQVFNPLVVLMGQLAYALACLFIYYLYKPVVPVGAMQIWLTITVVVFGIVGLFDLAFVVRRPAHEEVFAFWRKVDKKIPMAFDFIAVGVLFLLYPYGHESLKILTVAFFVGYVPLQMISDPENVAGNRFSTVAVLGSFAATLIWNGDAIERVLAVMMIMYGAVLFIASTILRNVVICAVDARLQSEKNATILAEALADVSASRDAKTRFIAAASHDLGQPLQAASLYFGLAMQAKSKRQRESAAQGVRDAFAAADQLLSHMLNHLSLKADVVNPHLSSIKIGPLVKKLVRQFTPVAKAQGIELRTVYSSQTIVTDSALLERLLSNFLSNAIRHSHGKTVLVGLKSAGRQNVGIWVIDDGRGILASDANHVFDEYYRGAESIAETKGGFGIGLASAKRIATLLGGEAGFVNRAGHGAAFYVKLPKDKATP